MRKKKKDGLESKVFKFKFDQVKKDADNQRYIPYCDFHWHRGLILDESVCNIRRCKHYHKMYISNLTREFY